jgi:hypothetical protein
MWLSGSRLRKRIGENGLAYFLYLLISRSTGMMFARMFLWVRTTPFGSAVAPEVNRISAVVSPEMGVAPGAPDLKVGPTSAVVGPTFRSGDLAVSAM